MKRLFQKSILIRGHRIDGIFLDGLELLLLIEQEEVAAIDAVEIGTDEEFSNSNPVELF